MMILKSLCGTKFAASGTYRFDVPDDDIVILYDLCREEGAWSPF